MVLAGGTGDAVPSVVALSLMLSEFWMHGQLTNAEEIAGPSYRAASVQISPLSQQHRLALLWGLLYH